MSDENTPLPPNPPVLEKPAPDPIPASVSADSAAERLATVLEEMKPMLLGYLKVRAREAKDVLFWLWVKRLGMAMIALVVIMFYVTYSANMMGVQPSLSKKGVVIVDISGPIGPGALASGDRVVPIIDAACKNDYTEALVVRINSPGGAPADAERIGASLDRCKKWPKYREGGIPRRVYAIIDGVGASAGYMIAVHADHIAANATAMVGSIGVILSGIEFSDAMDKWGVDSREYSTGPLKGAFSPYRPDTPAQRKYAQALVDDAMIEFRGLVVERRPQLDPKNESLFTGAVWTGNTALKLGLIDEVNVLEDILARDFPDMPRQLLRPRRSLQETMQMDSWIGALESRVHLMGSPTLQ